MLGAPSISRWMTHTLRHPVRTVLMLSLVLGAGLSASAGPAIRGNPPVSGNPGADPLPSWVEGSSKRAVLRFVQQASGEADGSSAAVPPEERIAVFDNDGTLWSEQPLYFPFQFCVDRIRAMAQVPPAWRTQEPFASARRGDLPALLAQG